MTDPSNLTAAKLDEIEREIREARASLAQLVGVIGLSERMSLDIADADALVAAARQTIALRALIDEHNAGCEEKCSQRRHRGLKDCYCGQARWAARRCHDCPRRHMIELPAEPIAEGEKP